MAFQLKKILVTGAFGYLGARLCKYLAEKGFGVTAFGRSDPFMHKDWVSLMDEVMVGDIRNEEILTNLAAKQFDIVIHLISLDHHKSEDDPNLVSSINVMPTWNLLYKFTKRDLKKFIYFSTIQVYGKLQNKIITEEDIPSPLNQYGLSHLLSEHICNYFNAATETSCINIRLSNSYGEPVFNENNCWELVINEFCKMAVKGNKINLTSDGSPIRDFIHYSDVCKAVELLIINENDINNNIVHIASGETHSILELAHSVKNVFYNMYNKEIQVLFPDNTISYSPEGISRNNKYFFDISRMGSLGFAPANTLDNGIKKLLDYLI